jgi:hypothetical protein
MIEILGYDTMQLSISEYKRPVYNFVISNKIKSTKANNLELSGVLARDCIGVLARDTYAA